MGTPGHRANGTRSTRGSRNGIARLRAVGVSDDGKELLLSRRAGSKTGAFRIAIDEELVEHLQEASRKVAVPLPAEPPAAERPRAASRPPEPARAQAPSKADPQTASRAASKLTPREIQTLLRQGRTVEWIARKAGVDEAWVERFEPPIVWERANVVDRARKMRLLRARRGLSTLALGDAVEMNVRERNPDLDSGAIEAAYTAVRHPKSGTWVIRFSFPARGRTHNAEWSLDLETNQVVALNKLASDLGWSESRRRTKTPT